MKNLSVSKRTGGSIFFLILTIILFWATRTFDHWLFGGWFSPAQSNVLIVFQVNPLWGSRSHDYRCALLLRLRPGALCALPISMPAFDVVLGRHRRLPLSGMEPVPKKCVIAMRRIDPEEVRAALEVGSTWHLYIAQLSSKAATPLVGPVKVGLTGFVVLGTEKHLHRLQKWTLFDGRIPKW